MTVEAVIKGNSIFFYENGKVTYMSVIEQALMDLRWAGKHQPSVMTPEDYGDCVSKPLEPIPLSRTRGDQLHSGYRIRGHSQCPWCNNYIKSENDPAGTCIEDVSIYAHFEDSIHGPIEAVDFLTGILPVKELVDGKIQRNCPFYDFNPEAKP